MSFKLLSCLFVLTLAALACKGDSRNILGNPNYRDLYYRNQFYNQNPFPIPIPTADRLARRVEESHDYDDDENDNMEDEGIVQEKVLPEDIYSFIPASAKRKTDPNDLSPILYSMRSQLRQVIRSQKESEVTNKNILSVLEDTLSWAKTQAASFYSLISTLSTNR